MAYLLQPCKPLARELRRVARERIDSALDDLRQRPKGLDAAVHSARKRCKELRGLLRLFRESLPPAVYMREDAWFRDAARQVAAARDAAVMGATCRSLIRSIPSPEKQARLRPLCRRLKRSLRLEEEGAASGEKGVGAVCSALRTARRRLREWRPDVEGWEALAGGLRRTYRRGRREYRSVSQTPTGEALHEWRKHVKYHRYHCHLLSAIWPTIMEARHAQLVALSECLGLEHDLFVLDGLLAAHPEKAGTLRRVNALRKHLGRRRTFLQQESLRLGERIYAESPRALVGRFAQYWEAAAQR